eukprot:scaffold22490_cov22-Tisochrysis_lutea.AAC.1
MEYRLLMLHSRSVNKLATKKKVDRNMERGYRLRRAQRAFPFCPAIIAFVWVGGKQADASNGTSAISGDAVRRK